MRLAFWRRRGSHAAGGPVPVLAVPSVQVVPAVTPAPWPATPSSLDPLLLPPPDPGSLVAPAAPAVVEPGRDHDTAVALVFADGAVVSLAADDPRVRPFQEALAELVAR